MKYPTPMPTVRRGFIEFDFDKDYGNLTWEIFMEIPLPSRNPGETKMRETTIFADHGRIPHKETEAEEYRLAISKIAKKFAEWERIASQMWRESLAEKS